MICHGETQTTEGGSGLGPWAEGGVAVRTQVGARSERVPHTSLSLA